MTSKNIAIVFSTGRTQVREVAAAFMDNLRLFGHTDAHRITLYLSIDTSLEGAHFSNDFLTDIPIKIISDADRRQLARQLLGKHWQRLDGCFLSGNGYAPQRNAAILEALQDGQDYLIFFDDDEYPHVPKIAPGETTLSWYRHDTLAPHLEAFENGDDVSYGYYLGYPLPVIALTGLLPKETLRAFGKALSLGCEVVYEDTFIHEPVYRYIVIEESYASDDTLLLTPQLLTPQSAQTAHGIRYPYDKAPLDVAFRGGNLGINLHSIRNGKIPFLFFNPASARGEDIIFYNVIQDIAKVRLVDSFIFHDPFQEHLSILNGHFPTALPPPKSNEKTQTRFAQTLLGWLKYAPLFISQTTHAKPAYHAHMQKMLHDMRMPLQELGTALPSQPLAGSIHVLQQAADHIDPDLANLALAQELFLDAIMPAVNDWD
uniref:Glycosyl transferase family 2 n=1 Tax=Candidatus Kentrum sp. LPFa TaxID=2126335 RepID=A0A450WQC1_9GAMM|nr:MAG: hypothetical protein BECKLPF1236B_GA0070989_11655 [Candidatus Kentron sp. LPFa]